MCGGEKLEDRVREEMGVGEEEKGRDGVMAKESASFFETASKADLLIVSSSSSCMNNSGSSSHFSAATGL